jgi:hypothetical protein
MIFFSTVRGGPSILEVCNDRGETPLLMACRLGFFPIVGILSNAGAAVKTADKNARTPIWYLVAQKAPLHTLRGFLERGAEVDTPDYGKNNFFF